MDHLLFLVNDRREFDFADLLQKHLPACYADIATEFPPDPLRYRLVVLWNYRQIIKELPNPNNVVLFHSSDLPEGRGWSPIYNAIVEGREFHVISGIFAAPQVDAGDVIVKAKFKIDLGYTASDLRKFDHELSIILIGKILTRFADRPIVGVPQEGISTYRPRRRKEDNEIDINLPLMQLVTHLRACEPAHPAYFQYAGHRYNITVTPAEPAERPRDVQIIFSEDA